jgi:hypothetical protein
MSEKLKELEVDLEKLIEKSYGRFDMLEKAFNLGLDIANELNRIGLKDYKIACIENKKNEELKKENFENAIYKIKELLLKVIRTSVKLYIVENESWTVEKKDYLSYSHSELFDEDITDKFFIQYVSADMDSYGGDFELEFETTGELKSLLEKYDINGPIKARLGNDDGEEYTTLYEDECARRIRSANLPTLIRLRDKNIEDIDKIYNDISKIYTFQILSADL